jgi:putative FmdB family regulatory protein
MPIYEYACTACGREFDLLVASERLANEQSCPHCNSPELTRKFSTFASHVGSAAGPSPKPHACGKFS